jgi:hypothetical protein
MKTKSLFKLTLSLFNSATPNLQFFLGAGAYASITAVLEEECNDD